MQRRTGTFSIGLAAFVALTLASTGASAHPGDGVGAGFLHPFTGLDHVLAMLAVGLWAGLASRATRIAAPAAFAGAMIVGAVLAMAGVAVPAIEQGIAASLVVFGLLAVLALRLGPAAGAAAVGAFALFHGAAHGAEMGGVPTVTYIAGFTAATLAIQLSGIGLARLLSRAKAEIVVRVAGGTTAVTGLAVAFG